MRYGGDEFLVMGFFHDEKQAEEYKDKLQNAFETWNAKQEAPYKLKASIGYSRYLPQQTLREFINRSDENLYEDKRRRKKMELAAN